jgi:hypothetical protein
VVNTDPGRTGEAAGSRVRFGLESRLADDFTGFGRLALPGGLGGVFFAARAGWLHGGLGSLVVIISMGLEPCR